MCDHVPICEHPVLIYALVELASNATHRAIYTAPFADIGKDRHGPRKEMWSRVDMLCRLA